MNIIKKEKINYPKMFYKTTIPEKQLAIFQQETYSNTELNYFVHLCYSISE